MVDGMVVKTERIIEMVYGEIKAIIFELLKYSSPTY